MIATWKLEKRQQDDVAEIMTTEEPTAGAPSREEQRALDQAKREAQEHKKLAIIAWKKEKQHQLQQEAEESKARQAEVEARKAQEQLYRVEMKQKVALYRLQKQQQDVAKKDLKQYTKKAVDISKVGLQRRTDVFRYSAEYSDIFQYSNIQLNIHQISRYIQLNIHSHVLEYPP